MCDSGFSTRAANVVCRQLGYYGASAVLDDSYFGSGMLQFLSGVEKTERREERERRGEGNGEGSGVEWRRRGRRGRKEGGEKREERRGEWSGGRERKESREEWSGEWSEEKRVEWRVEGECVPVCQKNNAVTAGAYSDIT